MTTANHSENQKNLEAQGSVQINDFVRETMKGGADNQKGAEKMKTDTLTAELPGLPSPPAKRGTREHVEMTLAAIDGTSLTKTIKACNGLERGSYRVTVKASSEWNEITVKLRDGQALVASSYIDRGHTKETRTQAAQDVIDNVRMFLCR